MPEAPLAILVPVIPIESPALEFLSVAVVRTVTRGADSLEGFQRGLLSSGEDRAKTWGRGMTSMHSCGVQSAEDRTFHGGASSSVDGKGRQPCGRHREGDLRYW